MTLPTGIPIDHVEVMGLRLAYRRRGEGHDEPAPLNVANALHDAIPTSELVVMPGLGHECHLESSETFSGFLGS